MKILKIIVGIVVLVIIATASAPLWGGCDVNKQICYAWCSIRHMDSSVNEIACKGSCEADRLSCMAK